MNSSPPLIKAVETKNIIEYRRLIDTGEANINENMDWVGYTAIHIASMEGHVEIAVLLAASGADANIRNTYGWTALHSAAYCDRLEIVHLLLCQGANMDIRDFNEDRTTVVLACQYSRLEVADCLRKWPWTMAIIALQELNSYKYLDFSSIMDLWQYMYMGNN